MTEIIGGIGVGRTAVVAEVFQVSPTPTLPDWARTSNAVEVESQTLIQAIAEVKAQFKQLIVTSDGSSAEILDALVELLIDEALFEEAAAYLEQGWSAAASFGKAADSFSELLSGDAAMEERSLDLQDLSKRVQAVIAGINLDIDIPSTGSFIVVAEDFSPADTSQFPASVVGVITTGGGPTSHTSIICRSRGIPALVGAKLAGQLEPGTSVLLDPLGNRAVAGGLISDATPEVEYVPKREKPIIKVLANIGSIDDAVMAAKTAASGVGLFRSELLYLNRTQEPSVESQINDYSKVFAAAPIGPFIVRTFDPQDDKPLQFLGLEPKASIANYRVLKSRREILANQLRAVEGARQATGREVWVMAPMIGSAEEALDFADLARQSGNFKVGVMVEQLSLIPEISKLKGSIDFLSVGTNDLAQNLFNLDRQNLTNPELLDPWHPEFLLKLTEIAQSAKQAQISVSVCGEVAANPAFAVVLAQLGFSSVSVAPSEVEAVSVALRS